MESKPAIFPTIDAYIEVFPEHIQKILQEIRQTVHDAAPEAVEKISYQMPTFVQNGTILHFAAYKKHIGIFGTSSAVQAFHDELSAYAGPKGNLQFPIDQPIPIGLIRKIVAFQVAENRLKAKSKQKG